MDASSIIASEQSKHKSILVEKEIPPQVDPGLLAVSDLNSLDYDAYVQNREELLQSTARDGCQVLVQSLFSQTIQPSADGPLAMLPSPTTLLPRSKPLPKRKPPTKWEKFAAAKGIQHKRRDRRVFDEEKQEWVNRWGRGGKNHEKEDQWITELPDNAAPDFDPAKAARTERKARIAKNKKQQLQNIDRATGDQVSKGHRKQEIEKTLASTRISTASMGKFDKRLEGDRKLRGVKRKFESNETSADTERTAGLALMSKMESESKRAKRGGGGGDDVLNVRKAIRAVSKGKGAASLATRSIRHKGKRTKSTSKR